MRIGVCGSEQEWAVIAAAGYDYVEANFSWLESLDDSDFEKARRTLADTGLKAETFNCFFGAVKLYELDDAWLKDYAARAFERAALLGGEIAVLGSSGARNKPDGLSLEEVQNRFANVLSICGDAAVDVGMKIVIEPLRRRECNFINTLTEGVEMVKKVAHPAVGALVDFFHFYDNGETLDEVPLAAPYLWHTHLARPKPDRGVPRPEDIADITPYAEALRSIGYKGRISLECHRTPDFNTAIADAVSVMDVFRKI